MPSTPRSKKMQKVIDAIIGKPITMVKGRRTEKENELHRRMNYDSTRMIR